MGRELTASWGEDGARAKTAPGGPGILYLVATPIGNLDDFSRRAIDALRSVDLIAAEDTRRSSALLSHHRIGTEMVALYEHNEGRASDRVLHRLLAGQSAALISDAGTPLISDPGLPLVRKAREQGIRVVPIPGPCAAIVALSASGLAVDRFAFEGFPPRTSVQRRRLFESLRNDRRTLIFYESCHRIRDTVSDLASAFEDTRRLVIARELTKLHETIVDIQLSRAMQLFDDVNMHKGEFVLLVEGAPEPPSDQTLTAEQERILKVLLTQCSVKSASGLAAKITGARREMLYRRALELTGAKD